MVVAAARSRATSYFPSGQEEGRASKGSFRVPLNSVNSYHATRQHTDPSSSLSPPMPARISGLSNEILRVVDWLLKRRSTFKGAADDQRPPRACPQLRPATFRGCFQRCVPGKSSNDSLKRNQSSFHSPVAVEIFFSSFVFSR